MNNLYIKTKFKLDITRLIVHSIFRISAGKLFSNNCCFFMKVYSTLICLAFCGSLLTSCVAPKPVLRLHPEPDPGKWFFGHQYTRSTAEGVEVVAAFEGIQQDMLVFDE